MQVSQSFNRLTLLAAATAVLAGTLATPGHAAAVAPTAHVTSTDELHYEGSDLANKLKLVSTGGGRIITLEDTTGTSIEPGEGCRRNGGANMVLCEGAPIRAIRLVTLGGPDEVRANTPLITRFEGGTGNDTYFGPADTTGGNVTFIGGADIDAADYGASPSGVLVDMDGQADDGRLNADHDNIDTTVENLLGSDFNDSLRGNSNDNRIVGREGADALRGGNGDDEVDALEPAGADGSRADVADLSCGTGIDVIRVDLADPQVSGDCETVDRRPV
ncbi:hypothetical protein [Nonomuraea jiangxiensis]|uniref:Hemolysin-type calcium-binding repeat-containing protein n=1 Tax=Nonomuraea jiangxiensis TaxID=633440 RepID=A0A1G9IBR0_9ACTN|nr:hypothetical protein [Nonomuraea jiangxiensis]SDL22641.1 hypothetical protein SAMN05421869_123139 [Nonomuraea jiangxiensis]